MSATSEITHSQVLPTVTQVAATPSTGPESQPWRPDARDP